LTIEVSPSPLLLTSKNLKETLNSNFLFTEKNGFVTATKLGTTNKFFVAATQNFDAAI